MEQFTTTELSGQDCLPATPEPALGISPNLPSSGGDESSRGVVSGAVDFLGVVQMHRNALQPSTRMAYAKGVVRFARWWGLSPDDAMVGLLKLPREEAISALLGYESSMPASTPPGTVNARMAGLRSLITFARKLGVIPWEIPFKARRVVAYRDTRGPEREFTDQLLERLGAGKEPRDRRDYAMARLLLDLGLRRNGVVSLRMEDLELERSSIWVALKGYTQRVRKELPAGTLEALKAWIAVRGEFGGPLFTRFSIRGEMTAEELSGDGLYRVVRGWGRVSGVTLRPHGFRHAAITRIARGAKAHGYGLPEIRAFSNHQSVANLSPYLDAEAGAQKKLAGLLSRGEV